jgi:type IV pilus assembly protein PilA
MTRFRREAGGFTLIELLIVVAIIGALTAIAIPGYLRFQLRSKSSEGKTNLSAIRTAEESYYAEHGVYVSAAPSPPAIGHNQKVPFSNAMGAGLGFDRLGWAPEGPVYFNYSAAVPISGDQFTLGALADIDLDAIPQTWGFKKGAEPARPHADGTCDETYLAPETVGPCDGGSGRSVF